MSTHAQERIPEWTRGDRFRKARSMTGLTVQEFAGRIGISPKSVNNYEGDKVEPRKIVLNAWALATGVPVEWLETGEVPNNAGPDGDGGFTLGYGRVSCLVAA
jgi:transcriptional regulator with XRE-family HTH domain